MSLHLFDLSPIKSFSRDYKFNLAVSIAHMPDGTLFVVSRYGDVVWDFYPYIPQENLRLSKKRINWCIKLPDGRMLTDPEHADLLESSKDFIWSLFTQPIEGRQRPTMSTLTTKFQDLIPLLCWMVKMEHHCFADISGQTMDYVQTTRLNKNGKKAADSTVIHRLIIIEQLYHQRENINDALQVHPWPEETAHSLAGVSQTSAHRKPKTEFIPDIVATQLAEVSLNYVQKLAPMIIQAKESAGAAGAEKIIAGFSKNVSERAHTAIAREMGFDDANDLNAEGNCLRTACYIIICMFSGIRDSEMMSIGDDCVVPGKSRDGTTDVLWLHGTIYKTGMHPKKWLVPPVVEEAVKVLTRLTEPLRNILRQEEAEIEARLELSIATQKAKLVKRLDAVRKYKNKLFLGKKNNVISVFSGTSMRRSLKRFCSDHCVRGEDGHDYRLHSHQFRRTYARFIARSELGDLMTLRDHFGHWSIDMTVSYADGGADDYEIDMELLEMITAEKLSRQKEVMSGYLDSNEPLANGGYWLKEWRSTVRTAANKEALIAEYAGTITLNGTGHSWCVGNAKGNGCGGLCVFEAQMCVDCNYGIIGQEHRPIWQGIYDQQNEALALDDIGPGGRARAQQILESAAKVLRQLDGQDVA